MFRAKHFFFTLRLILSAFSMLILFSQFSNGRSVAYATHLQPHAFTPTPYGVGIAPMGIAVGDIMGPGHQDIAVANLADNNITILTNNGSGVFTALPTPIPLAANSNPRQIVAGDFTSQSQDHEDLATADQGTGTVSILLNTGNGTFPTETRIPVGNSSSSAPIGLVAGHFMGQPQLDLAVADSGDDTVTILANDGNGTFIAQTPITVGGSGNPSAIAVGDFMGQGHQDLAITNSGDNTVRILANNGSGVFTPKVPINAGNNPFAIAAGNIMGQGHQDLAITNSGDNTVTILANDGSGVFTPEGTISVGNNPRGIVIGNLTGTGYQDLAVANSGDGTLPGTVTILANNGSGSFTAKEPTPVGLSPTGLTVGNFIGRGQQDLAITNTADSSISVLINTFVLSTCGGVIDSDESIGACNTLIKLDINPGTLSNQVPTNVTFTSNNVHVPNENNTNFFVDSSDQDQLVSFQFTDNVIDTRNTTAGWNLTAQSTGLTNNNSNSPAITDITLGDDPTNSTCSTTVCTPPIASLIPHTGLLLSATPQIFVDAPTAGTGIGNQGNYHLLAIGSFTVPAAAIAGSTYSGFIRVTLIDAAS